MKARSSTLRALKRHSQSAATSWFIPALKTLKTRGCEKNQTKSHLWRVCHSQNAIQNRFHNETELKYLTRARNQIARRLINLCVDSENDAKDFWSSWRRAALDSSIPSCHKSSATHKHLWVFFGTLPFAVSVVKLYNNEAINFFAFRLNDVDVW